MGEEHGSHLDGQTLEKVLACPRLPSLPAVALRVIELTSDANVPMRELAETIQSDQGLATKILRTVNSPFYGMARKCSTIHQAQLMLGLNGVKTLALGFSLVSSLQREKEEGFDYESYWRRAIYSAVAAKCIGKASRSSTQEEAFLAALLQDIGMIALYRALGKDYVEAMREAGDDHQALGSVELARLEIHHADIGAMLAERWRLPEALVAPIRYHERPTAAPAAHQSVARSLGAGNLAAASLSAAEPAPLVGRYRSRLREWFSIDTDRADELLLEITSGAHDLSRLLQVPTGQEPDVAEILGQANERLVEISLDRNHEAEESARRSESMQRELLTDGLTGVASRGRFHELAGDAFTRAARENGCMSLALVDPDDLRRINEDHGWLMGDAVIRALAQRLQEHTRTFRGVVGRCGGEEFGVLLLRVERAAAAKMLQSLCESLASSPLAVEGWEGPGEPPKVTISAGLATLDASTASAFTRWEHLVNATDQALHAAKAAGGNCVRVFSPRKQPVA